MAPSSSIPVQSSPPSSLISSILSLGGLLDGQPHFIQIIVLGLIAFHITAICVWVASFSRELRLNRARKAI
jgi:hypothetical protein